jgi:WD40 repeat protein
LTFAPDGKTLASGDQNGTLRIGKTAKESELRCRKMHLRRDFA